MSNETINFLKEQLEELERDLKVVNNENVKEYIKERIDLFEETLKVANIVVNMNQ